jgi:hypothetical protein
VSEVVGKMFSWLDNIVTVMVFMVSFYVCFSGGATRTQAISPSISILPKINQTQIVE